MELRLVGPFEIRTASGPQPLRGRGERALLALLALNAGQPVAVSTLIEALWEAGDLPDDPTNALQLRVSKLRRTLAAIDAPNVIQRVGSGYRLQIEPNAVDAHRITELIETARRTGDPDAAATLYGQALTMWRGEPLADFAGAAWTLVESGRLAELRLAAIAERADRMLSLGRYEQVVTDLEPVVATDPTRERLVGQLMTALFNAGRQAEALDAFNRTREALTEELGLDPSRDLRTVMEQILRQDSAITPAQPSWRADQPAQADRMVVTGNIPLRLTSFIGRDRELAQTGALLRSSRLVTLVGPGGAGKTTLSVEAARAADGDFPHGAWLVRLATVHEAEMLVHAVADAIGLSIEGGTAAHHPSDVLIGQLEARTMLIVLDNCEHLIEPVASFVEALLGRCLGVRVLATSREALAVPGEVQLLVAPLPVPEVGSPPDKALDYASVRLFLDRAEAATADRIQDAVSLAAVAEICQRLDGIPLALELAAARLSSLTPLELANRVQDRFAVLTTGGRTADARHRTLRNTVAWSHDMLSDTERVLFRRFAAFRGGWTLDAAEAVVTGSDVSSGGILDVLDRLVRRSLVVAETGNGRTRYRMLETLRQYADERLAEAGETEMIAAAHAAYFLGIAEQAEKGLRGPTQRRWLRLLREEHPNLRAALAWLSNTAGQADAALRLAGSLGLYWHMGRHLEGRQTLRTVLALDGGSTQARARAMQAVSLVERPRACIVHPSEQCAAAAHESLTAFDAAGDRSRAALSRLLLAVEGVGSRPRVDAVRLLDEADQDFAALDDDWGRAVVAFVRMEILFKRGDEATAREAAEEATKRFRALRDGWGLSAVLYHYGYGLQRFGAFADAVPLLEEAIDVAADSGVHNTVQWASADLGLALLALGRIEEASSSFARAGTVSDEVGDHAGRALASYGRALLAAQEGDHARARPLFETARAAFERLDVWLATGLALAGLAECDVHAGDLASAADKYRELLALAETAGEVGLLAVALEGSAIAIVDNDAVTAAEMLGRASWLRDRFDRPATQGEQETAAAAAAAARGALGQRAFEAAAKTGATTGLGVRPA